MKIETMELRGITKKFGASIVLDNIDLLMHFGRIYGIAGINGSGKTLLFKIICGFIYPDAGEVYLKQTKLDLDNIWLQNLGILIENAGFVEELTVFQNLKELTIINKNVSDKQILNSVKKLGLDEQLNKKYKALSLGMKQKLAIVQAIFEDPEIIILDEPFNSLDKSSVEIVKSLLLELKLKNKLIIITSHNETHLRDLCDETYELKNSRIFVYEGGGANDLATEVGKPQTEHKKERKYLP